MAAKLFLTIDCNGKIYSGEVIDGLVRFSNYKDDLSKQEFSCYVNLQSHPTQTLTGNIKLEVRVHIGKKIYNAIRVETNILEINEGQGSHRVTCLVPFEKMENHFGSKHVFLA